MCKQTQQTLRDVKTYISMMVFVNCELSPMLMSYININWSLMICSSVALDKFNIKLSRPMIFGSSIPESRDTTQAVIHRFNNMSYIISD